MEYAEVTLKFQRVAMADLISTSILSSSQKKKRKEKILQFHLCNQT